MRKALAPDIAGALDAPIPLAALRSALQARIDKGSTRDQLVAELITAMLDCRAAGDERADDLLADGLDMLTGWTSPHLRLPLPDA